MTSDAMTKGERTRQKMIDATALLLQRQGYHATGLTQIVEESGAPRGSLYFHFPGGKDELARCALEQAGSQWRAKVEAAIAAATSLPGAIEAVCGLLADELVASNFQLGCPIAAVALEDTSPTIQQAVAAHYRGWHDAVFTWLARAGMNGEPARRLATMALASIEGALLLAKVERSAEPVRIVGSTLRAMAAAILAPR